MGIQKSTPFEFVRRFLVQKLSTQAIRTMHKISVSFIILSVSMCFAGDFVPNQSGAVLGTDLSEDLLEIDIKGQDALTTNQGKVCDQHTFSLDFTSILKKLE